MTVYFVTRHPGAVEWAHQNGITVDTQVMHLQTDQVASGDVVIGTLPVNLAAEVCDRGAHYMHVSMTVPAVWRGRDLTAAEMTACGAQIEEYRILRVA
jgi:CRISPR-associated protein Csx16